MKIVRLDNVFATGFVLLFLVYLNWYFNLDFLNPIQNTVEDFYITDFVFSQMRDYSNVPFDTNIVLINIGSNRKIIAEQLKIINKYKPKVIGIDIFFLNEKTEEEDSALVSALRDAKNVVLASKLIYNAETDEFNRIEYSHKKFSQWTDNAYANLYIDLEKYFRTSREFFPKAYLNDTLMLAFPLKILQYYNPKAVEKYLERNVELEVINFKRNIENYRTFDWFDVFEKEDSLAIIKDKIVLFGTLGIDLKTLSSDDIFFTPKNKEYIGKSLPDMYGVVIHANIISMILEEDYVNKSPSWLWQSLLFLIIYFNMVIFGWVERKARDFYEPLSIFLILLELVLLLLIILHIHYFFNYELYMKPAFYALLFCPPAYEMYRSWFKPILKKSARISFRLIYKLIYRISG